MSGVAKVTSWRSWTIVGLLLLVFGATAWSSVRDKSTTFDEIAHMTAGASYWLTGDYRLHPENGNLPQRWAAIPLVLGGVTFPDRNDTAWWHGNVWFVGHRFFYELQNDLASMLWRARGMIVLLGMVLGGVVYVWSRRLFGNVGGLISLVLYVLSPSILANTALATSDLTVSLMFLVALGTFWMALHKVSAQTAVASAVAMGLLFVAKMSAVLILPVVAILVAIRITAGRPLILALRGTTVIVERGRQIATLACLAAFHAIVVVTIIWTFYGFHFATFREAEAGRDTMHLDYTLESLTSDGGAINSLVLLANKLEALPEAYLFGFAFTLEMAKARSAFLNGEYSVDGWRMFFPYTFLIKTPLAVMVVLGAAATATVVSWRGHRDGNAKHPSLFWVRARRCFYRTAPLIVFLIVYWTSAITSHINIGHRHILPTYPPLFILCGAAGYWFHKRITWPGAIVALALCQLAFETAGIYPHYLAYFNQLAGGPSQGYRRLVDSSLDWGQDLPTLKHWLDEQRDPTMKDKPVYLSYFGTGDPVYYRLDALMLPSFSEWRARPSIPLQGGTYCISATLLQAIEFQPRGNWTPQYEQAYQMMTNEMRKLDERAQQDPGFLKQLMSDPSKAEEVAQIDGLKDTYERFRFARLCGFLRMREPNASAGYSILIYDLTDEDVNMAIFHPLSEWRSYLRGKKQLSE